MGFEFEEWRQKVEKKGISFAPGWLCDHVQEPPPRLIIRHLHSRHSRVALMAPAPGTTPKSAGHRRHGPGRSDPTASSVNPPIQALSRWFSFWSFRDRNRLNRLDYTFHPGSPRSLQLLAKLRTRAER